MKSARLVSDRIFLVVVFALVACVSLCVTHAEAQTGNNAVYNSSGNCSVSSPCASSPAFIDASVFASSSRATICAVLNYMLTPSNGIIPSYGAVIDARGLPFTTPPTSMTCTTFVRSKLPNESI